MAIDFERRQGDYIATTVKGDVDRYLILAAKQEKAVAGFAANYPGIGFRVHRRIRPDGVPHLVRNTQRQGIHLVRFIGSNIGPIVVRELLFRRVTGHTAKGKPLKDQHTKHRKSELD